MHYEIVGWGKPCHSEMGNATYSEMGNATCSEMGNATCSEMGGAPHIRGLSAQSKIRWQLPFA